MEIPARIRMGLRWAGVTSLAAVLALGSSPAQAEETSSVSGRYTDNGQPISAARVDAYNANHYSVGQTYTDLDGRYTISLPAAGEYKLSFTIEGLAPQWSHQKNSLATADPITVGPGNVVVDEELAPFTGLSGLVTRSDGSPAAAVSVAAWPVAFGNIPTTVTDGSGRYRLPVSAGGYRVRFTPTGGPEVWAHGQPDQYQSQVFDVAQSQRIVVDEQLPPAGRIIGHLTDGGQPVASASISISGESVLGYRSYSATTSADGSFAVGAVAGSYQVTFRLPNGLIQFAHGKTVASQADPVVVTVGADTVLEEQVAPTGTISGHLRNSDGTPAVNASVMVVNGMENQQTGTTDSDGSYQVRVYPGSYLVSFATTTQRQWATAKTDPRQSALVAVNANQASTVDETLLATGSLVVTARDAKTHQPIAAFCANVDTVQEWPCTANGTVEFANVGPGQHSLSVYSDDPNYGYTTPPLISVTGGQSNTAVVDLVPQSRVKTTILDKATGQPVADACLEVAQVANMNGLGKFQTACSGGDGKVELAFVGSGVYKAFVWAEDGVHGHQWVGLTGGVGAAAKAKPIVVKTGETVTLSPVRLDKAATLTGTVTDAVTGQAVPFATVGIETVDTGYGGGRGGVPTDGAGHYTLANFGPYEWPILTSAQGYAPEFTGDTPNRLLADGVKLTAGQTTTRDIALGRGTTLTGTVVGPHGPILSARIIAANAVTGDTIGVADTGPDGVYRLPILGPQLVTLSYNASSYGVGYLGSVPAPADPRRDLVVAVPASGSKTVNITATEYRPY